MSLLFCRVSMRKKLTVYRLVLNSSAESRMNARKMKGFETFPKFSLFFHKKDIPKPNYFEYEIVSAGGSKKMGSKNSFQLSPKQPCE